MTPNLKNCSTLEGKKLPHDHESEEGLIACCLLPDPETPALSRALEKGVIPDAFYVEAHKTIWAALQQLHASSDVDQIDEITLLDLLQKQGLEDDVGGIAAIYSIQKRVETPVHANHFANKVLELYSKRRSIRALREGLEALGSPVSDVTEVSANVQDALERIGKFQQARPIEDDRWKPDDEPDEDSTILTCADKVPLRRGNVSVISGKSKAGKSAFRDSMIAACFSNDCDALGWRCSVNSTGAIIVFDYEQSKNDFIYANRRIWKRANRKPKERFFAYRFRDYNLRKRQLATLSKIKEAERSIGSVDLIILDGGADLVPDVNQIDEANAAVDQWLAWSSEFNCHICVVIHSNEGQHSGKDARGHLGKQCHRKAEAVFVLEKSKHGETAVYTPQHRKAGISENEPFVFKWDDSMKMHVSVGTKADTELSELHNLASSIWADSFPGTQKPAKEIISSIMKIKGCEERNANYLKQKLCNAQVLKKGIPRGNWIYNEGNAVQVDNCTTEPHVERLFG